VPDVISFDGVRLSAHVLGEGEGEPVTVMGHGLTSTYRDFEIFAPFLPGTKVLFDFRGHGDSECPPPGSYTTEHFAQDLAAVAKEYEATCAAGVSLGVAAILRILATDPDRFDKLVFLLPGKVPVRTQVKVRLFHLADLLEQHSVEETAEIILAEEAAAGAFDAFPAAKAFRRDGLLRMNREGIPNAIRECIDDPPITDPDLVRRCHAPTLLIAQENDLLHDADVARELASLLPNAELHVFPDQFALLRDVPTLVQRSAALLSS
jgi:pimeloyl-ACP methyl ester carboxylesterase